ncbi:ribokinase [Anaeramoeba flamelloides]|uniref:Ribokinase n=1 Tax=Anaeramoeba flamelloides TaxID=1746091 RepID=A0AAV7Z5F9_9EUKA|nr:ribokinase [Anaeramoeba flamelloides]KAJ6244641.1 ribokinase [Anaeramoeba flamelloides]
MSLISVVGSCSIDFNSYSTRLPVLGETLIGTNFTQTFGGKGANQAYMCRLLQGESEEDNTAFIGCVGSDSWGKEIQQNFGSIGVDTKHLTVEGNKTGIALINIDKSGDNSIVIHTGANSLLSTKHLQEARETLLSSKVVVTQLEIDPLVALEAMKIGKEGGAFTILNPAPGLKNLPEGILEASSLVCPNETECEIISGIPVTDLESAKKSAQKIRQMGALNVVVTLGSKGCVLLDQNENFVHFPVKDKVVCKDSTGAGDSFVGALAYGISKGVDLTTSLKRAVTIATISVQNLGTQTSFPSRKIVEKYIEF